MGEKVGEVALAKSGTAIQATRKAVQDKLTATQTAGVLAIAEAEPTETNLKLLETVLLTQMRQDQLFAAQLQALNQQIQAQTPNLQAVLDTVRVRGNVEVGNIEQVSETGVTEQIVGRNLGVGRAIPLDILAPEEAHTFLLQRTQRDSLDLAEQQALKTLAQELGYLPLALEQAAAYIQTKQVSFATYLRSYQQRRLQVLEKKQPQVGHYPQPATVTLELARLLHETGYFLDDQGRYTEAESLYRQA